MSETNIKKTDLYVKTILQALNAVPAAAIISTILGMLLTINVSEYWARALGDRVSWFTIERFLPINASLLNISIIMIIIFLPAMGEYISIKLDRVAIKEIESNNNKNHCYSMSAHESKSILTMRKMLAFYKLYWIKYIAAFISLFIFLVLSIILFIKKYIFLYNIPYYFAVILFLPSIALTVACFKTSVDSEFLGKSEEIKNYDLSIGNSSLTFLSLGSLSIINYGLLSTCEIIKNNDYIYLYTIIIFAFFIYWSHKILFYKASSYKSSIGAIFAAIFFFGAEFLFLIVALHLLANSNLYNVNNRIIINLILFLIIIFPVLAMISVSHLVFYNVDKTSRWESIIFVIYAIILLAPLLLLRFSAAINNELINFYGGIYSINGIKFESPGKTFKCTGRVYSYSYKHDQIYFGCHAKDKKNIYARLDIENYNPAKFIRHNGNITMLTRQTECLPVHHDKNKDNIYLYCIQKYVPYYAGQIMKH